MQIKGLGDVMSKVGLFFFVEGKFLFSACNINNAEDYGDFKVYPKSHNDIWNAKYYDKYKVDFDYYPRGRVVYRKTDDTYLVYYDQCIEDKIGTIVNSLGNVKYMLSLDEHYKCHMCNENYFE